MICNIYRYIYDFLNYITKFLKNYFINNTNSTNSFLISYNFI